MLSEDEKNSFQDLRRLQGTKRKAEHGTRGKDSG